MSLFNLGIHMQDIYQDRILELARSIKLSRPIANPTHRAEKNNPICGDKVIIDVTIENKLISDIHLIVRGCALCEAGAGVWKETAIGKSSNELYSLRDELNDYLRHAENPCNDKFKCFEPVKKIKNRIECVLLCFEAATGLTVINSD